MDIIALDIANPALVEDWYHTIRAIQAHDLPDLPEVHWEYTVNGLRHPWAGNRDERWIAVDNGRVLGHIEMRMPTLDNPTNIELDIGVLPQYRRRGIGRALHAKLVERARVNGRTTLISTAVETLPGTGVMRGNDGNAFAAAIGAERVHNEVRRRWEPGVVADAELDRLLAEAWKRAEGYELLTWQDSAPEHVVADVAYLDSRLVTDAPMGELAWEPENVDVHRVRQNEAAAAARKRRMFGAGVVHAATGRLVAYTLIAVDHGCDWHGWQHITIVDPAHRGRRLGTVVKLENLAFVRSQMPSLRAVDTWNAAENAHMIDINEAMGFRPRDTWANWQQKI